jgi:hypothetical protein
VHGFRSRTPCSRSRDGNRHQHRRRRNQRRSAILSLWPLAFRCGSFHPKVLRLLSDELTGTVLREIDALFSDNDVPLGPPQLDENDPGERRERMRRYLASLNLDNPLDHAKLMGVYSDLLQEIARRKSQYGFDADTYRDRWIQNLEGRWVRGRSVELRRLKPDASDHARIDH